MIENVIDTIQKAKNIAIFPHINMDGDALGSVLALFNVLKNKGYQVSLYVEEEIPTNLSFLPRADEVILYKDEIKKQYDLAIALDTADLGRLGKRVKTFNEANCTINIDHHPTNTNYATYNLVVSEAAACGEIMYDVINMMDALNQDIASCLYTAIAADTGGFRFSNTKAITHKKAANLIELGADCAKISRHLFEDVSINKLKITSYIIQNTNLYNDGKIAITQLTRDVQKKYGATDEDINGFSNLGRSIRGVEVAIYLREKNDGKLKISMRSKNNVDVSEIATRFGGGGHKRAAGFDYDGNMQDIIETLKKEFSKDL